MPQLRQYSIHDIQDEVRALATKGVVRRQQKIYELGRFFGHREWENIERILETNEYLLRDCVIDLIGHESWAND
jgi:hypothetical protein